MMILLGIIATLSFLVEISSGAALNQWSGRWCFIASVLAMVVIHVANILK